MNSALEVMLSKYNPKNNADRENAIKEIIQEIVLAGLSRGGFFNKAAFYGGTCLRIFHGLNRFSEDLDFALLNKDKDFKIDDYFPSVQKELMSYGIEMEISSKLGNDNKDIQTAFVKGNSVMLLLHFFPNSDETKNIFRDQRIKIKFEIDIDNPSGGTTETRYQLLPAPYEITIFDESTLFAGKVHAVIHREFKNRVKGRDFYDYLFYIAKGTKLNLTYLENKLKHSGTIEKDVHLTIEMVKDLLTKRFENVDYESAKADVIPFIQDKNSVESWSKEMFLSTLLLLK